MIGKIISIVSSFTVIECWITVIFDQPVGLLLCCSVLDMDAQPLETINCAKLYSEKNESKWVAINEKRNFKVWINYASECVKVNSDTKIDFCQLEVGRAHTEFVAIVRQLIDSNNIECSIGRLGENIHVVFTDKVDNLEKGDKVKFTGEVWIEVID